MHEHRWGYWRTAQVMLDGTQLLIRYCRDGLCNESEDMVVPAAKGGGSRGM